MENVKALQSQNRSRILKNWMFKCGIVLPILGALALLMWFYFSKKAYNPPMSQVTLPKKQFVKPQFKLTNPSQSGLQDNFAGPVPQEILISRNKTIRLINIFGSRRFRHAFGANLVAFSPDGNKIISAMDDGIKLWDITTRKEIRNLYTSSLVSMIFVPDTTKLMIGDSNLTVKLWDILTGEIYTVSVASEKVECMAFSPDRTRIVSASKDHTVKLWDVVTGKQIKTLGRHTYRVSSVAFSPDGTKIVSGSGDNAIKLWDATTGTEIYTFPETSWIESVAFSPDGTKIVSGGTEQNLKLWDIATKTLVRNFPEYWVSFVTFSPDGTKIVSGTQRGDIKLWDTTTGTELGVLKHTMPITYVTFSPDRTKILSASEDRNIKLWDVATKTEIPTPHYGHIYDVNSVSFSPDGTKIVSAGGDDIKVWDIHTGADIFTLEGHIERTTYVAFSPDGTKILSGGYDCYLHLWDATIGTKIRTFSLNAWSVPPTKHSVGFSPDGTQIVLGEWCHIKLLDATTGVLLRTLQEDIVKFTSVVFLPDGDKIVSCNSDSIIKFWDVAIGKEIANIQESNSIKSVILSPDGSNLLFLSEDGDIKFYEINTKKVIRTTFLEGCKHQVNPIAFSPDNIKVALVIRNYLKLLDTVTGKELDSIMCDGYPQCVEFSPDGKWILVGNYDSTLTLYACQ